MAQRQQSFEPWLQEIAQLPGLLACAIFFPDRPCISQTPTALVAPDGLDQAWQALAETLNGLHLHRLTATRLCWTYEKGQLHFAIRPDGLCLALSAAAGPETVAPETIESLLNQFLRFDHAEGA